MTIRNSKPKPQSAVTSSHSVLKRSPVIAVGAMCLALFMTNLDGTVVDVALPQIQRSLGASLLGLQWILNAYALPVASLLLLGGTLGDLYGRKQVFGVGLVIFTLASLGCGLAPNLTILIGGRSLQGIGAAALIPLSLTIVTDTFPDPQQRTKAIGVWTAVSALALVAGPVLGGVLVDTWGWRSLFFLNVPLGAIALIMACRAVPASRVSTQDIDWLGLLFSIVLLASLTYALTEGSAGAWRTPRVLWLLGVAGLSAIAFVVVESRSDRPFFPLYLLRSSFAAINLVPVLVFFTSGSLLFIFSLFFQQVQGMTAAAAAMNYVPPTQEGIASAVFNISIHLGGVLGIALQITVFAERLAADLARSLSAWNLPPIVQTQLIVEALHGGAIASQLPANISPLAFGQAFDQAFLVGLHTTVIIASVALLAGALLLVLIKPTPIRGEGSQKVEG